MNAQVIPVRWMFILVAMIIAGFDVAYGQFPVSLTLKSDGSITQSPVTATATRYRITVEGTYSMWPQFTDCHGVDAAYVYEVPKEEIDNWRWPPEQIDLGGGVVLKFVALPHWVGDDKLWAFPETGTPLFALSFRKYKGFRIDSEPLPNTGLNMVTHRYQVEKMGTGRPFTFSILDSNYNIAQQAAVPRYEDNCGSLKITVEAIVEKDLNICDFIPLCDATQRYAGAELRVSLFSYPSSSDRINLLKNINPADFTLTQEPGTKLTIDSIDCGNNNEPASIGLLIDRSGSMAGQISEADKTVRMTASRSAVQHFIDHLQTQDSAFVASFSDMYSVDQDWTNDKQLLKKAVNNLLPGGQTAFFGSVKEALLKVSTNANPRRALIVLSDGANTADPPYSADFLSFIQNKNIPIYIIALGLSSSPEDVDGRLKMDEIAKASRGRVFDVYSAASLDSVYDALGQNLEMEDCCSFYFRMSPCVIGTSRTFTLSYKPGANPAITRSITVKCDTCHTVTDVEWFTDGRPEASGFDLVPNPASSNTTVAFNVNHPGTVIIAVCDMLGGLIFEERVLVTTPGPHSWTLASSRLAAGSYMVSVRTKDGMKVRRMVVR
jgi:hypothetical protein